MALLADSTLLGLRADAWAALAAWVLALMTVWLILYAGRQLGISRETRDEQTRPYVIVDFHFRSIMIALSVKNIGQTPASDVRVVLHDRLESAVMTSVEWQDSALFVEGVPLFAPGREMRFALDLFHNRVAKDLPMTVRGTVEYWRFGRRGDKIVEPFEIDLRGFSTALLPPKDISDLGDEAEKIRKQIEAISTAIARQTQ